MSYPYYLHPTKGIKRWLHEEGRLDTEALLRLAQESGVDDVPKAMTFSAGAIVIRDYCDTGGRNVSGGSGLAGRRGHYPA